MAKARQMPKQAKQFKSVANARQGRGQGETKLEPMNVKVMQVKRQGRG